MISPELIRRFPFFAGLSHDHIVALADVGEEKDLQSGTYFFHENEALDSFYLTLSGAVGIVMELPDQAIQQPISGQLMGQLKTKDVIISTVGPGDVFAWSSMVPPYKATASARALTDCRVVAFDAQALLQTFVKDCEFGYLVLQKIAQVSRDRLHHLRIESLAYASE
jgi:CRP-like cAMP-binding protein